MSLRRLFAAPPRRGPVQNLNGAGGCALERARARWVPRMGATKRAIRCLAGASAATALLVGVVAVAPAQPGYVSDDPEWRFRQHGRRAKVALIAGSIGAFRDQPYGRLLHEWCEGADIHNLSQVGQGAPALYTRFRTEIIDNPWVPVGSRDLEVWLLFGGGLNSVGAPERTNRAIRRMFQLAYRRRVGVVGLTLTPWGSAEDDGRWRGARGLHMLRSTRNVVAYVLGRATPSQALGTYARERRGVDHPEAPWREDERPNIAIDLYDSPLRHRDAEPWPIESVREQLENDAAWKRQVVGLSEEARRARLERDARELAEAPRWFLHPEYRGFDHIHPNRAGHYVMAATMCPELPASWRCRCPEEAP